MFVNRMDFVGANLLLSFKEGHLGNQTFVALSEKLGVGTKKVLETNTMQLECSSMPSLQPSQLQYDQICHTKIGPQEMMLEKTKCSDCVGNRIM